MAEIENAGGAGFDRDPSDRNRQLRRRLGRSRNRLPAELADFKVADGRTLREIMGDRYFRPARASRAGGKWMSPAVRKLLLQGNSPFRGGVSKAVSRAGQAARRARNLTFGGML